MVDEPLEAYRIFSGLTRSAHELPQLLEPLEGASTGCAPATALGTDSGTRNLPRPSPTTQPDKALLGGSWWGLSARPSVGWLWPVPAALADRLTAADGNALRSA